MTTYNGGMRARAALPLALAALTLAACSLVDSRPVATVQAPSDGATRTSRSPSPKPSATRTPTKATPTPEESSATPSQTAEPSRTPAESSSAAPTPNDLSPVPRPSGNDGDLSPVWYPNWTPDGGKGDPQPWPASWPRPLVVEPTGSGALDGKVVLVDPGHNSGNSTHTSQINKQYWVGLQKICNTTGTETAGGYEEAAYTFDVASRLTERLAAAGATVVLTRDRNDTDTYGPCIQGRGLLGGQVGADIGVSIHADGGPASGRGAFVYTPAPLAGYTDAAKAAASAQLASSVLAGLADQGLPGSTYLRPNIAPDREQGTLNSAEIPIIIVETLNMANRDDASIAESSDGRQRVADGLYAGIRRFLTN